MNASRRHVDTAGFSLLEVMCAIVILGLGVVGMTHGIATALRASQESERQTQAALVAAGRIETLRAEGWLIDGETEGRGNGDLARYQWRESIRETELEGLYEVVVAVTDPASEKPICELSTLLFEAPLTTTREPSGDSRSPNLDRPTNRRAR